MHEDDRVVADADGKPIRSKRQSEAVDAVMRYFQEHPEAGRVPYFHHRAGIVAAVVRALTKDA